MPNRIFMVTDERHLPLKNTTIECFNVYNESQVYFAKQTDRGGVLRISSADIEGLGIASYYFRPRITRRSGAFGGMSMGGQVHLQEIQPPGTSAQRLIFLTQPQQVDEDTESDTITVQRTDFNGNPITQGDMDIWLYSTSPGGTFAPSNELTILDGDSTVDFTYTDDTAGNPVLTASDLELV